jgi:hypothetical protein
MTMDDEKIIKKLYRGYMASELSDAKLDEQKKKLIREHFATTPSPIFTFSFAMPAFALVAVFAFFFYIQKTEMAPSTEAISEVSMPAFPSSPAELYKESLKTVPNITVKRVTSQVGPTVVYQKTIHDTPVTVVWVFPEGKYR